MFVFDVSRRPMIGFQAIESAVEVPYPEAALAVRGQRRNIAVAQQSRTRMQHRLPSEAMSSHAIETTAGKRENTIVHPKQLMDFCHLGCGSRGRVRTMSSLERNGDDALIFRANKQLAVDRQQSGGKNSGGQGPGEASAFEHGDAQHGADVCLVA